MNNDFEKRNREPTINEKLIPDNQAADLIKLFDMESSGNNPKGTVTQRVSSQQRRRSSPSQASGAPKPATAQNYHPGAKPRFNRYTSSNREPSRQERHGPIYNEPRITTQKQPVNGTHTVTSRKVDTSRSDIKDNFIVKIAVLVFSVILLGWLLPSGNRMDISTSFLSSKDRDTFYLTSSHNLLREAVSSVHEIPPAYILEMSDVLTPKPDKTKFIKKEDDERNNYNGKPIDYYKDDSIEVKCWKEKRGKNIFNFAEVWISHPSQLRRTFVDNMISAKHIDYPENIFRRTNGVVGMSADYCAFRPGIIVQFGKVIRDKPAARLTPLLDLAVYDTNGNFSIYEDKKEFLKSEIFTSGNVIHTFAFGPVLVDNYEVTKANKIYTYQNGRVNEPYPRAAICQFGYDKHYLLCVVELPGLNLKEFADELQKTGVRLAYNLDGGQTGTLIFNRKVFNQPAYGGTREMSDILYFATAVPSE